MNETKVTEFTLLGFQNNQTVNLVLFFLFNTIYMLTLFQNLLIVVLVAKVPSLKSPMYFFLAQLSLCDMLLTTSVVPNLLYIMINGGSTISVTGCLTQYYFYSVSTATECLLLTVMSYDRYLAICEPLLYSSIMGLRLQLRLVFLSWFSSCLIIILLVCLMCNLRFCGPHIIDHYFCDVVPILQMSCAEHLVLDIIDLLLTMFFALLPLLFILFTYISIFVSISHISSSRGKKKSFSTCSSHLIVVSTYYGTLLTIYTAPSKVKSYNINKMLSLLYTMGTPFWNPIIYSFRSQEIKTAMKYLYSVSKRHFN